MGKGVGDKTNSINFTLTPYPLNPPPFPRAALRASQETATDNPASSRRRPTAKFQGTIHERGRIGHRGTETIRGRKQSEFGINLGGNTCRSLDDLPLHFPTSVFLCASVANPPISVFLL